jgi:hypothetical protein
MSDIHVTVADPSLPEKPTMRAPAGARVVTVSSTLDLRNAIAAGYGPDQLELVPSKELTASARANADAELQPRLDAAREEGRRAALADIAAGVDNNPELVARLAAKERTRILAIQDASKEGFAKLTRQAIEEGLSVEQYAVRLLAEIKDRGITMDQLRRDAPPSAAHARIEMDESGSPAHKVEPRESVFARRKKAAEDSRQR